MSTLSPQDLNDLAERDFQRWHRLQDERKFRVEQLAALAAQPSCVPRHESVNQALRSGATTTLREVNDALARMGQGRYGLCVTCSQPLTDVRLDTLPWTPLCTSCHFNEQNCSLADGRT